MTHKPYNIYKRLTTNKGKFIYYVQFYDEAGNRMTARSSGQTNKGAAENWAIELLRKGIILSEKNITFVQYAQDWWIWEKCQYVKGRLTRGASLSRAYVDTMRSYLIKHILPTFGGKKLNKITTKMIESWLMDLREKPGRLGVPLNHITVNHCLKCLKVMLKEAKRLGYLHTNPAEEIRRLSEKPKGRSILRIDEVKELFLDDNIDRVWDGDLFHYTLNLTTASTGMRMGEIQALMVQNVHEGHISILYSWDRKYGLKEPK